MHIDKLKILMIGPSESGKSWIANVLSESVSSSSDEAGLQRPTQGARVLEFELAELSVRGNTVSVDVELWDCSGDHRFESCWPALRAGVQGVILVCSPHTSAAASRELELLYNYFVSQPKLLPKQCLLLYNCTKEQDELDSLNLSSTFTKVSQVVVDMKTGANRLKIDFSNFVSSVLQAIKK